MNACEDNASKGFKILMLGVGEKGAFVPRRRHMGDVELS